MNKIDSILKIKNSEYRKKAKTNYPWRQFYYRLCFRCKENPRYNGKILLRRNLLTMEDVRFMWFRDKAYKMDKPSIDRIDNNGDYALVNCQFIEHRVNAGKDNLKIRPEYIGKKISKILRNKYKYFCKNGHSRDYSYIQESTGKTVCRECKYMAYLRSREEK